MRGIIAGQGRGRRIPVLLHPWVSAQAFESQSSRAAAQALLERIDEKPVESALIEAELVVRESTVAMRDEG